VDNNSPSGSFSVSLRSLREIDQTGNEAGVVNISEVSFTLFTYPTNNETNYNMWVYFAALENQANITVTVS
jgi:hypothetical protein